jgi:NAD(P)-dependent dehydrogenase (short-subunit alcohol dehydrogenase family)
MAAFGMGKAALRSLAQTLAAEGAPRGIHVCHVVVDAPVDIPLLRKTTGRGKDELADPREIAKLYVALAAQSPTCWTSELDVHIRAKL